MHGSMLLTYDGKVLQQLGIPHPPGLIPVIPKYKVCRRGAWSRSGVSLCRGLGEYSPQGLLEAAERIDVDIKHDPLYASLIPYVHEYYITQRIGPLEAFGGVVRKPRSKVAMTLVDIASNFKGWPLGLTGSTAIGAENDDISDIDLVVVTWKPSRFAEAYMETVEPYRGKPGLWWRRGFYRGIHVSWVGVPPRVAGHCAPLESYWRIDTPRSVARMEVNVEPGQESALLYPPCVEAEGMYLVSYQYNYGYTLYRGGRIRVAGAMGEYTIYVGVSEAPIPPSTR